MLTFTSAQFGAWLAAFIWPFTRILALIATDPILGGTSVSIRVKVALAVLITLVLVPVLPPPPAVDPGSPAGLLILGQQVIIGAAMGLTMRIVFGAVEMAGHLSGLQMGLGFATFFDPINASQVSVVSQFLGMFTTLVFLSINGHLMVLSALAESFRVLPIAAGPLSEMGWRALAGWGGQIFLVGVLLAFPVVAALLITNLAIGVMTRAAPQLNIFAVGFPLTLGAGFLVLYLSLPYLTPLLTRAWQNSLDMALQILRLAGGH